MANDLTFGQIATLLNSVVYQATGQTPITPTNTSEFVSVAQTALKVGYDPILNAISQVQTRTIFSVRPYTRKFKGLQMSESRWGNFIRKLQPADLDVVDDDQYKWPVAYDAAQTDNPLGDGESVDMYKIRKPRVLQTMFYGRDGYQDYETIHRNQLDMAFRGPEEFGSFYSMITQNRANKLEQYYENMARTVLLNLIAGIIDEAQTGRVVHLLTEYNTFTGQQLTKQELYQGDNYKAFIGWMFAKLEEVAALMSERTTLFQTQINNFPVRRHTPMNRLKMYLSSGIQFQVGNMVLPNTFNSDLLKWADHETVNFWQSIQSPQKINITPVRTAADGTLTSPTAAVEADNIVGVLFDEEAAGYAVIDPWTSVTPINSRGGYWNIYDHVSVRTFNDFTEKAVVFMLD